MLTLQTHFQLSRWHDSLVLPKLKLLWAFLALSSVSICVMWDESVAHAQLPPMTGNFTILKKMGRSGDWNRNFFGKISYFLQWKNGVMKSSVTNKLGEMLCWSLDCVLLFQVSTHNAKRKIAEFTAKHKEFLVKYDELKSKQWERKYMLWPLWGITKIWDST